MEREGVKEVEWDGVEGGRKLGREGGETEEGRREEGRQGGRWREVEGRRGR